MIVANALNLALEEFNEFERNVQSIEQVYLTPYTNELVNN
jgi:hypothetical protein